MNNVTKTFETPQIFLNDALRNINEAKIQLPDFQRGWVWDDEHIKSLLASISLSYPIGSVMMLETGNDDVRFRPRLVAGVKPPNGGTRLNLEMLILDGQQRLTALFQSLFSGEFVETIDARKKKIMCWYYIDMEASLNPYVDREEAILSIPKDKITRKNFDREIDKDFSSPEREFEAQVFPLSKVFSYREWANGFRAFWKYDPNKVHLFDKFEEQVLDRFDKYQIPVIKLLKSTPKEAVCQVFEKVNTGGVSLTVFELLTATFAADDFDLRADWEEREKRLRKYPVLQAVQNDDFLQGITLLTTLKRRINSISAGIEADKAPGVSCKRKDVLALQKEDYAMWSETLTEGFKKAAQLLYSEKIFFARDLPYRTQLVPLAAVYAMLGDKADKFGTRDKLVRWYWCGVLGELYSSAIETRFAKDLPEILNWIETDVEPTTVIESVFIPNRLLTLKTRNSAAYKGISALLLRDKGLDFATGKPVEEQLYADEKIDIHHIFPADWCDKNGIDIDRRDSIVNKTPLSARTNRSISNNAPSVYVKSFEDAQGKNADRVDEILLSHVIDPHLLRTNQFQQFFEQRKSALLERIQRAMKKSIPLDIPNGFEAPNQFYREEDGET